MNMTNRTDIALITMHPRPAIYSNKRKRKDVATLLAERCEIHDKKLVSKLAYNLDHRRKKIIEISEIIDRELVSDTISATDSTESKLVDKIHWCYLETVDIVNFINKESCRYLIMEEVDNRAFYLNDLMKKRE